MHIGLSSDMGVGPRYNVLKDRIQSGGLVCLWSNYNSLRMKLNNMLGMTGGGCFPAAKPHVHLPLLFSGGLVGDEPKIEVQMLVVKRMLVPGNLQLDLQAIGDPWSEEIIAEKPTTIYGKK
ncbi:methylenetetrahydrofolate reductase 1 [Striga asiatica]|uniref:Methylenetetrahydrofolate reductase 1 n=1 Tax=Striga asiatica TaxID=4170 RepID=A0A5A7P071_STRAF|nr:methylenetetrahydrofolate reductase 1 [Striga asiatica]